MRYLTALLFTSVISGALAQTTYQPNWNSLDQRPTPEWWQDGKFGIFIHWGVYSVPAFTAKGNYAEWYLHSLTNNAHNGMVQEYHRINFGNRSYYDLADDFHAELYNPDEWAQLFERAGAKYVVLTSKHHDGFCLWPSQESGKTWGFPWSADVRGPKRDLLGDLFTALKKTSVKPGLYYSLYEWYNPLWQFDPSRYAADHAMPQLYDLVQHYQPWVVWADGDWDATPETWKSQQFLAWLYNESPVRDRVVVNDRWGSGVRFKHGGIYTPEYQPDMDFEDHDWEESRGMGFSYGYNRAENAWDYNSAQSLILHLIDKVSRGGNFLLDIGPDAHGQIPPIMQDRLLDIGKWMDINGEAIYNTRRWRSAFQWSEGRRDWKAAQVDGWKTGGDALLKLTINPDPGYAVKEVFYTWNPKTKTVYAIFPKYPADKKLVLKGLQIGSSSEVSFLATKERLRTETANGATTVFLPDYNPSRIGSSHAFVVKIANFGAFVDKPTIQVEYDPYTMRPSVSMSTKTQGATIRYTTDGTEPRDNSPLYDGFFQPAKPGLIQARAYKPGFIASKTAEQEVQGYAMKPALQFFRQPDPGLSMKVMQTNGKYNAETVEAGSVQQNVVVQDIAAIPACASQSCGMIWQGNFSAPQTGGYQFWTESDDGSILYIDGEIIVDNDGDHGFEEKMGRVYLQKGYHNFKLVYFNSDGGGALKVSFAGPEGNRQPIPAALMSH
ncbi:MAG: alpha-L-fucosidase [Saprospiraceae bacterium]|nr:alpha-L-fucosidase [Saprospiraceae bacterium]